MRKKQTGRKKPARRKGGSLRRKSAAKKRGKRKFLRGPTANVEIIPAEFRGLGPRAGGQSGDIQGLRVLEESGPESVEELNEEGQDLEAELISGVEDVPDADQGDIRSRRFRENNRPPAPEETE